MAATFTARYRSECSSCGQDINKGDEATFAAFDEIVHVTCPPEPTALRMPVCEGCYTELPLSGVCGSCE